MIKADLSGEVWYLDQLCEDLKQDDDFELTVCSPGGSSLEGLKVARIIQERKKETTCKIVGFAASAAAVIALACDKVIMTKSDGLMLHHCWTCALGNKEYFAEEIETMKAIDSMLDAVMTAHCSDDAIQNRLNEGKDVWLTGEMAAEVFDHVSLVEVGASSKKSNANMAPLIEKANQASLLQAELTKARAANNMVLEDNTTYKAKLSDTLAELNDAKAKIAELEDALNKKDQETRDAVAQAVKDYATAILQTFLKEG